MAENTLEIDGMIEALENKIAALQKAIASLHEAKDAMAGVSAGVGNTPRRERAIALDEFTGRNITEAAEAFLRIVGRPPQSTQEIVEGLQKGGLERVSPVSVAMLLIRSHNTGGKVVRVQKGLWGLEEWYGKHPAKITRIKNGDEEVEEQSEEAQNEQEEVKA